MIPLNLHMYLLFPIMISYLVLTMAIYIDLSIRHTHLISMLFFTGVVLMVLLIAKRVSTDMLFRQFLLASVLFGILMQLNLGAILLAGVAGVLLYTFIPKALGMLQELVLILGFFTVFLILSGQTVNLDRSLVILVLNTIVVEIILFLMRRFTNLGRNSLTIR